jgi:uncharacterized protein YgiM (DUF1202 family)
MIIHILPHLAVILVFALLTACASETKQSPSTAQPSTPAPAPAASKPAPAPATAAPKPAPAPPAAKPAPAPPPTAAAPPPPAPAPAPAPAPQQATKDAETPQVLVVTVARANLREKADAKSKIVNVLTRGTKVTVVSKGDQWYQVKLSNGTEGWLAESVVKPAP